MKYIKKYNKYVQERISESRIQILSDIEVGSYDDMSVDIFNKILNNYKVEESIKIEISNYINNNLTLNESFFDKLRDRFPKASTVSNLLSDKAESVCVIDQSCNNVLEIISPLKLSSFTIGGSTAHDAKNIEAVNR